MKTELLSPAGSISAFKQAIYNGADAVYLATEKFGARAYAKNLTLDELHEALILAHTLKKKIYVTVNTIIKENELDDCKSYLKKLYMLGVDGIIAADFAVINYVKMYLPNMEVHASTQCGIKDINDIRFFENLKIDRCVLARENSFDEIKYIKENSKMPLEVFAYGALCVSYSGGCLFSSLLSLRSGNRGRCSQNCRREYEIYKNNELLAPKGFHLSMRDLNTFDNIKKLTSIGIDSLKIEGRMKNDSYVKIVTSEFRKKLDNLNYNNSKLDTVFHRNYTKGFIFNEDKGLIVDPDKKSNEGSYIGTIANKVGKLTKINLIKNLHINDRIRIVSNNEDYYFTIDKLYNNSLKSINEATSYCLVDIYKDQQPGAKVYKMIDDSIDTTIDNTYKLPLTIRVYGSINKPLSLRCKVHNKEFMATSSFILQQANQKPLNDEMLFKQLSKLNETSFYLNNVENNIKDKVFITVSALNEVRRELIDKIENYFLNERTLPIIDEQFDTLNKPYNTNIELVCKCQTIEQYNELKKLNIKTIYFDNYVPYVNAKYSDIAQDYILAGNYGAMSYYKNKIITTDYSFNTINSDSIYYLLKNGASYVCLSLEMDMPLIKETITSFNKKFGFNAPVEMVVYGKQTLMTMKYCPIKKYGQCGKCQDNTYTMKDDYSTFATIRKECITYILNNKPLDLIDNLSAITLYVKRIRLDFTNETPEETNQIVNKFKQKLENMHTNKFFDSQTETTGYFKRPIQ